MYFLIYDYSPIFSYSSTTCVTYGEGTAYRLGTPKFTPVFHWGSSCSILCFLLSVLYIIVCSFFLSFFAVVLSVFLWFTASDYTFVFYAQTNRYERPLLHFLSLQCPPSLHRWFEQLDCLNGLDAQATVTSSLNALVSVYKYFIYVCWFKLCEIFSDCNDYLVIIYLPSLYQG